ncbi:MAG: succinate dehydrogenase assembly factor 2 [Gammaproteobacteria bacterium]|nr:succinate dehydrogenase assembly factor 2 [Gammaproteobacteria bacterium]
MRSDRAQFTDDVALPTADRLRWKCRRGMLELDLLLDGFLSSGYSSLSDGEKQTFIQVLEFEDQLLLDWIMGNVVPADADIGNMLIHIRAAT